MTAITHHIPDALLAAYATGSLPHAFSVVVASHVSMCPECRAVVEAHQVVGGIVLENTDVVALSNNLKMDILAQLDDPVTLAPAQKPSRIFPGPVMEALKGKPPRWKSLGMGVRQDILSSDSGGSVRLLYIPPGRAVPEHSHNGMELTLVLQGSFSDATGQFCAGDVEVADEDLDHTPVADEGVACICLAATDAPLRFNSVLPRLLQPLFRI